MNTDERLDQIEKELKSMRKEIISDLESTFYDTIEFSIVDINGYILTFSEEKN